MGENFSRNFTKLRERMDTSLIWIKSVSWMWKIMILIFTIFLAPFLQFAILSLFPLTISLFFIKDETKGVKRGLFAFFLASISQMFLIVMAFVLQGFNDSGATLDFISLIKISLVEMMMLLPGYVLGFYWYGLNIKGKDGTAYISSFVVLGIINISWNILLALI